MESIRIMILISGSKLGLLTPRVAYFGTPNPGGLRETEQMAFSGELIKHHSHGLCSKR